MLRDVMCIRCDVVVCQEETARTTAPRRGRKLCPSCKSKSLEENSRRLAEMSADEGNRSKISKRMKSSNPMKREDVKRRVSNELKRRYANGEIQSVLSDPIRGVEIRSKSKLTDGGRKKISDGMKSHNPMFDANCKQRMSKTFRQHISQGLVVYKRGPEHHLWKGNRRFNALCRQLLYPVWTKEILKQSNYTCAECGRRGGKLHVHHVRPLREIIEGVRTAHGIEDMDGLDDNYRYALALEVVNCHTLQDGMCVCRKCHAKIDRLYKELGNAIVRHNEV